MADAKVPQPAWPKAGLQPRFAWHTLPLPVATANALRFLYFLFFCPFLRGFLADPRQPISLAQPRKTGRRVGLMKDDLSEPSSGLVSHAAKPLLKLQPRWKTGSAIVSGPGGAGQGWRSNACPVPGRPGSGSVCTAVTAPQAPLGGIGLCSPATSRDSAGPERRSGAG